MKLRLMGLLGWGVASLVGVCVPGEVRASSAQEVTAAVEAKDVLAAHRAARAWVEAEPTLPRARLALATTYAQVDAPVAAIEQVRAGLRLAPEADTARALRQMATVAYVRLGEHDAAWVSRLSSIASLERLSPEEQQLLVNAYEAMLSRHAWNSMLERLTREAATGGPEATLRLASLTQAGGDLGGALAVAQRGRERFPEHRALLDEWLRLLALDLREAGVDESPTDERLALLRSTLAEADRLGADFFHAERLRIAMNFLKWSWREEPEPEPLPAGNIAFFSKAVLAFEREVRAAEAKRRKAQAESALRMAVSETALKESGAGKASAATWRQQLETLAAGERALAVEELSCGRLYSRGLRLQEALAPIEVQAAGALAERVESVWSETPPAAEDAAAEGAVPPDYDRHRLFQVVEELRTRHATAILQETLVNPSLAPGLSLAATDAALAAGVLTPEAWKARSKAAHALGAPLEAGFAAARALQEGRSLEAATQSALLAEASTLIRANTEAARKAAAEANQCLARGELAAALTAAEKALRLDPLQTEALQAHIAVNLRTGEEAAALSSLRTLWRAGADEGIEWRSALNTAYRAGDWALLFSLAEAAIRDPGVSVDSWYFYGLAARALGIDHVSPEVASVLKPSVWHQQNKLGDLMVKFDLLPHESGFLDYDFTQVIGKSGEPQGLRLWAAWREGLRGARGKADPALRTRLQAAALARLLGQSSAADYAASEAAKSDLALAAWVEGALAWSAGAGDVARAHFARAAAEPSLNAELRSLAARFARESEYWRPWRPTDAFHLTARMAAGGVAANAAAPGQLVLLSAPLPLKSFGGAQSQRIRGIGREATLLVGGPLKLAVTPGQGSKSAQAEPRVWEWEELSVAKPKDTKGSAFVDIASGAQLRLQRVECGAGVDWNVSGVLEVHEGTGSTRKVTVASGGQWLLRDAAWFVGEGSIAGRVDWRRGHFDLYATPLVVEKGGVFSLSDMSTRWRAFPTLKAGGSLVWQGVVGLGNVHKTNALEGWATTASFLAGEWPEGQQPLAGLTVYGIPFKAGRVPLKVATVAELEAALKAAVPGDVVQLAPGKYTPYRVLTLPVGVTLDGNGATFHLTSFGTNPVLRVSGAGFVRVTRFHVSRDDPALHDAGLTRRPVLEVAPGAIVELDGGSWDWSTFTDSVPSFDLKDRSRVFVGSYTFLRGSARLSGGAELKLIGSQPDSFSVYGTGRLLLAGLSHQGYGVKANGEGVRVDGTVGQAVLERGAGNERDLARQRLLRLARDTTWKRAASTLQQAYAAATNRNQRMHAANAFSRAVRAANSEARGADEEAGDFAWSALKPLFQGRPEEAPYLDLCTYPVFGPRFRPAADVGPAVEAARAAFRGAQQLSKSYEGTPEFDRAMALSRAFPPGSVDYAVVESAFQRGLTPAQLGSELRERAAREAAQREAARAFQREVAFAAEATRRAAAVAQQQKPMFTSYSQGAKSYVTSYGGGGSSSGSSQAWRISDSARAQIYSRELDVRIRQNTFGR